MEFPLAFCLRLRYDMGVSTQEKRVLTRQILYTAAAGFRPAAIQYFWSDKVVVGKYTGTEIKLDGMDYTIVKQSDILAIVE